MENQNNIENLEKLAEQGNSEAQYLLGLHYEQGDGLETDLKKAYELYSSSAIHGYDKAEYKVGRYCSLVKCDYIEAFKWFKKSAEKGNPEAQYELGMCYFQGKGVQRNRIKAIECFTKIQSKLDELKISEDEKNFIVRVLALKEKYFELPNTTLEKEEEVKTNPKISRFKLSEDFCYPDYNIDQLRLMAKSRLGALVFDDVEAEFEDWLTNSSVNEEDYDFYKRGFYEYLLSDNVPYSDVYGNNDLNEHGSDGFDPF